MVAKTNSNLRINLRHLTRIEGHGNIVVEASNGVLERCEFEVVEAPRYIESMLRGRPYQQASLIASRICGICAVAHATASLGAVESALEIQVSPQTRLLRELNFMGEMLDSHILHIYMLVAPDLLGVDSVIPLASSRPGLVARSLRLKQAAGDLCALVGGRHTHPISLTVGGFTHLPERGGLEQILARLVALEPDIDASVALLQTFTLPDFERPTEYLALSDPDTYALTGGSIASSEGGAWPVETYRERTNEFQVTHSTAKHARHLRESYMVGALARFNLNYARLHPRAKKAAAALNLAPVCTNPYKNTLAQLVEVVHCHARAVEILEALLETGIQAEAPVQPARLSGEGVGAVEAPRGTLYHHYKIQAGSLTEANAVIPTGQNLANLEADLRALTPGLLSRPEAEITGALEMLVRAYDPCISCSTHLLEVKFV